MEEKSNQTKALNSSWSHIIYKCRFFWAWNWEEDSFVRKGQHLSKNHLIKMTTINFTPSQNFKIKAW